MPNNFKLSTVAANASADAVCALCANGYMRIYSGTQPATVNTAITDQVMLAQPRFGATPFAPAVNGAAAANAFTADSDAAATGAPTWFRAFKSDGTTALFDGSIAASDADMIMDVALIVQHAQVQIDSYTYRQPLANA